MKVLCKSCFLVWFLFCFPHHNYPTCSRGYHRMLTQIWHKQQQKIINQRTSPRCNNPATQTRGQWTKASNHGPNSIGSTLRSVFAPAVPSLAMAVHQNSEHFLWNIFFNTSLQYLGIFFNCGFFYIFFFFTLISTLTLHLFSWFHHRLICTGKFWNITQVILFYIRSNFDRWDTSIWLTWQRWIFVFFYNL